MAKKKINGTTLDDLANMVAVGFEQTATKEEMNLGFRELDRKISKIDSRADDIYEILARFEEGDILDLQRRIKILERAVRALGKHIG